VDKINPAVLTVKQLGQYLNVSTNVAYQLIHSDGFPTLQLGKRMLVPIEQLNIWIDKHTSQGGDKK